MSCIESNQQTGKRLSSISKYDFDRTGVLAGGGRRALGRPAVASTPNVLTFLGDMYCCYVLPVLLCNSMYHTCVVNFGVYNVMY